MPGTDEGLETCILLRITNDASNLARKDRVIERDGRDTSQH